MQVWPPPWQFTKETAASKWTATALEMDFETALTRERLDSKIVQVAMAGETEPALKRFGPFFCATQWAQISGGVIMRRMVSDTSKP